MRPRIRGFGFISEVCALGELAFGCSRYEAATIEASWPPVTYIGAGHVHSGRHVVRWEGSEVRVADRGTMLIPPSEFSHWHDSSDTSALLIGWETVLRVAQEASGLDPARMRFTGLMPVSSAAERQWLATAGYVRRGIYSRALDRPLLRGAAEELVAASLLSTFPNTTMTEEFRTPRDPATPATVRKAIAFIDAHAARPITLTDIADAAGVVPRTLQYAFRRHRDITPLDYLRRVRLSRAHQELLAAEPGDGSTVAEVAARWGYARQHRFAAAYWKVYGQAPARTLRS